MTASNIVMNSLCSTLATTLCIVILPAAYIHVQYMHSQLDEEMQYCMVLTCFFSCALKLT